MSGDGDGSERRRRKRLWPKIIKTLGWLSAFVVGVAGFATALVTISAAFPKLFPFWAPFDASILIRDVRVEKAAPTEANFGGPTKEPAAEVIIEYVEEKTGPSTLRECRPEVKLQDVYQSQAWPARSQTISDPTQAKFSDTFLVPREQYSKEASLRMVCERRITSWLAFGLPEVSGINKPLIAIYYLCLGEHREVCGRTANWVSCGTNPADWAKRTHPEECGSVQINKISDVGGNQCGYATFEIKCSSK